MAIRCFDQFTSSGLSPDLLYNRTINQVLSERNLTVANVLDDSYMVNHTMFNVLRDANMSSEAISAYTDTAGYEWVFLTWALFRPFCTHFPGLCHPPWATHHARPW